MPIPTPSGVVCERQRADDSATRLSLLTTCPVELPNDWAERVNRADNENELEALRRSVNRGRPYDTPEWQWRIAKRLGLQSAYRPAGRPGVGNRKLLVE
jgi:hypothetical protein